MQSILVFPSSLDASLICLEDARKWKLKVIGASSVSNDPYKSWFDAWEYLPFIHEDHFASELDKIITRYNVSALAIPHAPSYQRIAEIKERFFPHIHFIEESPYVKQMSIINNARKLGKKSLETIKTMTGKSDPIREDFLTSLLSNALPLYGESSREKIIALCSIFVDAPKGDVIELGVFFGKSIYVLNRLAAYFKLGSTLAIDPWDMELSIQSESPQGIQKLSKVWDWETVFQGFLMNMQASHAGNFNYLRMPSSKAWQYYNTNTSVISAEFGDTPYTGKISILHIDGNHDEAIVSEDFRLWETRLQPGGWIVFDDYEWSQGSGPLNTVNQIKNEFAARIETFFVAGGAAFMKLKR